MTERCEPTPFLMKMCVAVVPICINSQPLIYKLVDSMLVGSMCCRFFELVDSIVKVWEPLGIHFELLGGFGLPFG